MLTSQDAQKTVVELEQRALELEEVLRGQHEELEAVRDLNRELMGKLNTQRR